MTEHTIEEPKCDFCGKEREAVVEIRFMETDESIYVCRKRACIDRMHNSVIDAIDEDVSE